MNQAKEFNLLQKRDFGDLLQDSLLFVLKNAKIYLLSLIVFVGSIYLMIAVISAWLLGGMPDINSIFAGATDFESIMASMVEMTEQANFYPAITTIGILGFAASITLYGAVYGIIRAYHESPDGVVELRDVQVYVRDMFMPYLGLHLLTGLIYLGVLIVFGILFSAVFAMKSIGLGILLGVLMVCAMCYLYPIISLSFPARMQEDISSPTSISRAFKLIKGHWWETFGLLVIIGIVSGIVQGIVGAFGGVSAMVAGSEVMGMVTTISGSILNMLISGFVSTVMLTAFGLQYFNLQEEVHHEDSLIDEIGNDIGDLSDRGGLDSQDSDDESLTDGDN